MSTLVFICRRDGLFASQSCCVTAVYEDRYLLFWMLKLDIDIGWYVSVTVRHDETVIVVELAVKLAVWGPERYDVIVWRRDQQIMCIFS